MLKEKEVNFLQDLKGADKAPEEYIPGYDEFDDIESDEPLEVSNVLQRSRDFDPFDYDD